MDDVPFTGLAFAVHEWEGGLAAIHILPLPIQDPSYKTFKGVDRRVPAADTALGHRSLLHSDETFRKHFIRHRILF
jgi:hypothetical protein